MYVRVIGATIKYSKNEGYVAIAIARVNDYSRHTHRFDVRTILVPWINLPATERIK